jgi:hypothetical protein
LDVVLKVSRFHPFLHTIPRASKRAAMTDAETPDARYFRQALAVRTNKALRGNDLKRWTILVEGNLHHTA